MIIHEMNDDEKIRELVRLREKEERVMHHKTAVLGASVFAGFFISSYIGSFASFVCFAVIGALAFTASILKRSKAAALVPAGLAAAFFIYGVYSAVYIEPVTRLFGNTYDVTAKVIDVSAPDNDTTYITATGSADGVPVKFSLYCPDIGIRSGDTVEMQVKLSQPAVSASYNGSYNYSRGIFLRAAASGISVVSEGTGFSLRTASRDYSEYLRDLIREELPGDEGKLLLAMCFGDRKRLSAELSDAVTRSGLSHMTAVSGMHISLIVTAIMSVLDTAGMKKRRFLKFTAALLLSAVFMVFFDFTASVCRSGIMLVIFYASRVFRRRSSPTDSLGAAVLLILLTEPCACRDAGLLLSVCGTLGAVSLAPKLSSLVRSHFYCPFKSDLLFVGICASYCTLPASTLIFGRMSPVSAFSSVAVFPLFFVIMIIVLIFAFTGGVLAEMMLLPAGILTKMMIAVIRFFAGWRFSSIPVDGGWLLPFMAVSAVFAAAVIFVTARSRRRKHTLLLTAAVCACAFAGLVTAQRVHDSALTRITVFSDGKNCVLSVMDSGGISAFSTDVSSRLSSAAYSALAEHGALNFDLLCVMAEKKHGGVYSQTFDSMRALEKRYLDNTEKFYDIGGRYTAYVYEDAVEITVNGVSILLTDAASAPVYGGHDIAVYSGYKKAADLDINGITVVCDKRYTDSGNNAYYSEIELCIDKDGKVLLKKN